MMFRCFALCLAALATVAHADPIHLRAEDATLTGNTLQTTHAGFSGTAYVGDFVPDNAAAVWTIPHAQAGIYTVSVRCFSADNKGTVLVVNGKKTSSMLAPTAGKFVTQTLGKVELRDGPNTVEIDRGWGYYDIDSVDFSPAPPPAPLPTVSGKLSDPNATPQARALMRSLLRRYGTQTISGQYSADDNQYILTTSGKLPTILGGDLIDYTPSRVEHGTKPEGMTERVIASEQAGQLVTLVWHWNAPADLLDSKDRPWYFGFYTNATTFDVQDALAHPDGPHYKLLLRDIDTIAIQLQKYSDAGIPVLWRPLHEAEGGWFWWGAKGPGPFKQLWRLVYDRLVNVHHLHNLLWVYSAGTNPDWYPGDDVVDVVGIDQYPDDVSDPGVQTWETLLAQHGAQKPLALTEFGGVPDVAKMQRYGVRWDYFVSWNGFPQKMPPADVRRIYQQPAVIAGPVPKAGL